VQLGTSLRTHNAVREDLVSLREELKLGLPAYGVASSVIGSSHLARAALCDASALYPRALTSRCPCEILVS
jgi:hypothetical protein